MDVRGWKLLTIILGSACFVLLIFLGLFGYRLSAFNVIKQNEVTSNLKKQENTLKAAFQAEKEQTITSYTSDDVFGNFYFEYPKVWFTNAYYESGGTPELQFLADPKLIMPEKSVFPPTALKVQVFPTAYAQKLDEVRGQNNTDSVKLSEKEVKISGLKGTQFSGKTDGVANATFVVLPLREKSILIGTDDAAAYKTQFQAILDSFKLSK